MELNKNSSFEDIKNTITSLTESDLKTILEKLKKGFFKYLTPEQREELIKRIEDLLNRPKPPTPGRRFK